MKKYFFLLCIMSVALISCESNGTKSSEEGSYNTSQKDGNNPPGPVDQNGVEVGNPNPIDTYERDEYLFNRELFESEQQAWLEQDIQTYAFYQVCGVKNGLGQESSYQYIKNGEATYYRYVERDYDYVEVSEDTEDGKTGSGSGTVYGLKLGEDIYTTKGRKKILFGEGTYHSITITDLYTQIDALEKVVFPDGKTYGIYILYDSSYHYPSFLYCKSPGGPYVILEIKNLVIDPEILNEDSAIGPYPED